MMVPQAGQEAPAAPADFEHISGSAVYVAATRTRLLGLLAQDLRVNGSDDAREMFPSLFVGEDDEDEEPPAKRQRREEPFCLLCDTHPHEKLLGEPGQRENDIRQRLDALETRHRTDGTDLASWFTCVYILVNFEARQYWQASNTRYRSRRCNNDSILLPEWSVEGIVHHYLDHVVSADTRLVCLHDELAAVGERLANQMFARDDVAAPPAGVGDYTRVAALRFNVLRFRSNGHTK